MGQLTPAQAVERLNQILDSVTILDEVKERRLLLIQMAEHLEWMKEHRGDNKAWGAISRMFKLVSDQIERTNINIDDISTKLAVEHARYFVEAFMMGFDKMLRAVSERDDIIIEEHELLELAQVGAKAAEEHLDRVTVNVAN